MGISAPACPWEFVMLHSNPIADPFALLLHPEAVFQALEHIDPSRRPRGRICRPLDPATSPRAAETVEEPDIQEALHLAAEPH